MELFWTHAPVTDYNKPFYLGAFDQPDDAVEAKMIEEIDAILGHPERIDLPKDTVIFRQDKPLDGIWILLDGEVSLFKEINGEEIVFHRQTTGRILGLLALAHKSTSIFSCKTKTPATLIPIPIKHLDAALQLSESLQASFITVILKAMVRRNMRLVEIQEEVLNLNKTIAAKHQQVTKAMAELEQAQALLVESEKMATLGQLSAGVAHELNNPIAAIVRAAEFARDDLIKLAEELPQGDALCQMLDRTFKQKPVSTREQRAYRKEMEKSLKDDALASRLVAIGIYSIEGFRDLAKGLPGSDEEKLCKLELYHQLGTSLRNIDRCSGRISGLVSSLRSYARSDLPTEEPVSVHDGIDDTLTLFASRLHDVTVEKEYGDLPCLNVNGGELNQVWTNLVGNALDAMHDKGTLIIHTERQGDSHIAVNIIDNGPGILPENMNKIFELRFTTRKGRVDFGLGLGLSITRSIVNRHGGTIHVTSEPGRTQFSVVLPIEGSARNESLSQETQP